MNNIFTITPLSLLSLSLLFTLTACEQPTISNDTLEIRPVRVQSVSFEKIRRTISYAGEVKARYLTPLGFRLAGKLVERKVDVGDEIKAGQLLARIDPTDYRLSVLSSTAEVNAVQADFDKASADLQRYANLLKKNVISRTEFETYQTVYNTAEARLKQAKALLDVDENKANYTDLYAVADGIVTEVLAEEGEVIAQGQPVLRLAQLQEKEIAISIPEHRLTELQQATNFEISLWAYPQLKLEGKWREISPNADPVTRTYQVRVTMLNAPPEVYLGMTATVTLQRAMAKAVALIPLTALYAQGDKSAVWVVDAKTYQVKLVPVQLGEFYENQMTVLSGLQNGQWVVTAGTHKLYENQTVRLLVPKT